MGRGPGLLEMAGSCWLVISILVRSFLGSDRCTRWVARYTRDPYQIGAIGSAAVSKTAGCGFESRVWCTMVEKISAAEYRKIAGKNKGAGGRSGLEEEFLMFLKIAKIPKPEEEFVFAPPRKWRFDFAYPDKKIAIEIEGGVWSEGRHRRPIGFIKDMEKYNAAALHGWRVLRYYCDNIEQAVADLRSIL